MHKILLPATILLALSLVACAGKTTVPSETDSPTGGPVVPGGGGQTTGPSTPQGPAQKATQAPDRTPSQREAMVESIEVVILETMPVQIEVIARVMLSDACTGIGQITQTREGDTFKITITTSRPADLYCAQVIKNVEQRITLEGTDGLEAGTYTVDVNGKTASFTLGATNALPPTPSSQGQPPVVSSGTNYGLANVVAVEVIITQTAPPTVQVIIQGYLPDPCTQIANIIEQWGGNTVRLTVETSSPKDTACIQVIQDFEQTYTLQSIPGKGTYTLVVNDVVTQFTVN